MQAPSTTPGHLVINLDLKVKTKTKTGDKLGAPGASNRYGIIFQPSISAFGFRFPYLGGSIFLILLLRGGLTTYPPIRDPRSGAPLGDPTYSHPSLTFFCRGPSTSGRLQTGGGLRLVTTCHVNSTTSEILLMVFFSLTS